MTRTASASVLTDRVALPAPTTVAVTLLIPVVAAVVSWAPWRRASRDSRRGDLSRLMS